MDFRLKIVILLLLFTLTGCYLPLSGKVIDADTQQPIEGAIVLAQWTIQHGLGLTYHTVHKIVETETDKKGQFTLPGAYNVFVDQPELVIYKQGYIAWRNNAILIIKKDEGGKIETIGEKRTDYDVWEHGYVYKLEPFREGYSRYKNYLIMSLGIIDKEASKIPNYLKALTYEHQASEPELESTRRRERGK